LKLRNTVVGLLLLAGCSTAPHREASYAPDWQGTESPADIASVPAQRPPAEPSPAPTITLPPPAVAPPIQPAETWVPLQRWSQVNGLASLLRISSVPPSGYALRSTNGTFVLHAGNQSARWDGLALQLGFAPRMIGGQPYVHTLDLKKTIQPLLEGASGVGLSTNPVIVIDPGHGGENAGAKSVVGNHYEKEFTLDWARRLQALLTANNWRVLLTRTNDSDLSPSDRVAFAAEHKADVFLSLHFNAFASGADEAGLETYCLTPVGMPSNLTRGSDEIATVFPNNAFDEQNLQLALRVHRAILQAAGLQDRGVRHARFPGVLRGQQRPAILIEGGYLSNPREARLIGEAAYRQKLAEAVAGALLEESTARKPDIRVAAQESGDRRRVP
jgi:N-acetylmuramoyl-L-alanine amidase